MRILCKPDVYLSQETLSLTENNQFRSSQQRKAWERWWQYWLKKPQKQTEIELNTENNNGITKI